MVTLVWGRPHSHRPRPGGADANGFDAPIRKDSTPRTSGIGRALPPALPRINLPGNPEASRRWGLSSCEGCWGVLGREPPPAVGCLSANPQGERCSFGAKETVFAIARCHSTLWSWRLQWEGFGFWMWLPAFWKPSMAKGKGSNGLPHVLPRVRATRQFRSTGKRSQVKPGTVVCKQADSGSWCAASCFMVGVSPGWELAAGFKSGEEKWTAEIWDLPEVETRWPKWLQRTVWLLEQWNCTRENLLWFLCPVWGAEGWCKLDTVAFCMRSPVCWEHCL